MVGTAIDEGRQAARDEALIGALFEKAFASTRAAQDAGSSGEFYLLEKAIAEDFSGLKDVSALESRAARLAASREIKKHLQDEKGQQAIQYSRQAELLAQ
jgi:hypothetical protein